MKLSVIVPVYNVEKFLPPLPRLPLASRHGSGGVLKLNSPLCKKMKIVYCITNLSLMRGIERGTIVRANAISQIADNQVWICVTDDDGPPCIPLGEGVKLVDLDINYNDYGYGLRVLRKKESCIMSVCKHFSMRCVQILWCLWGIMSETFCLI